MLLWLKIYLRVVALRWDWSIIPFLHHFSHQRFVFFWGWQGLFDVRPTVLIYWDNGRWHYYYPSYSQACHSGTVLGAIILRIYTKNSQFILLSLHIADLPYIVCYIPSWIKRITHWVTLSSILLMGVWRVDISAIVSEWQRPLQRMLCVPFTSHFNSLGWNEMKLDLMVGL